MNHTYVYRKHLRAPLRYLLLMLISIIIEAFLLVFGLIITDAHETNRNVFIFTFILVVMFMFFFIGLETLLIYHLVLKRFKSISVTLTEEAIIYTNSKGQLIIPYEDIEKLQFPSIKYTGGWMKIIYRGGNIRLTVVIENIGGLISELKDILNEKEMSHVYDEKKMFSFFKTAVFSDESWERIYHNFKIQLITYYLSIIVTILILRLYDVSALNEFFLYGSIAAPLLGYLLSEIIIGMKVRKRVAREKLILLPRDSKSEQKIFYFTFLGLSVGYILMVLMIVLI